jgi:hypothetical protein
MAKFIYIAFDGHLRRLAFKLSNGCCHVRDSSSCIIGQRRTRKADDVDSHCIIGDLLNDKSLSPIILIHVAL